MDCLDPFKKFAKTCNRNVIEKLFYQKDNHYDLRNPCEFFSWTSEYKVSRSTHMAVSTI